mmetsp:Transcript_12978/g.40781  ORF Transcript_12978/g.40781 Transcript_12978/m.40781 type:complete len:218 (-) Transcript_12978:179-832(-)
MARIRSTGPRGVTTVLAACAGFTFAVWGTSSGFTGQLPRAPRSRPMARPAAAGKGGRPGEEDPQEPSLSELRKQALEDGSWLNPARGFARRSILESSAELAQQGALAITAVTVLEKAGMVARVGAGLQPLEDSIVFEYSGRLVSLVQDILLPSAQLAALFMAAAAVAMLLSEELQRERLEAISVDVVAQRRRRATTAALLVTCVLIQVSPPLPGLPL